MQKLKIILQCKQIFFIIFAFSLFFVLINQTIYKPKTKILKTQTNFTGIVLNYKIDGNKLTIKLKAKEKILINYYFKTEKKLKELKGQLKYGITLKVFGNLNKPKNNTIPNVFNYKKYLNHQKIFYILDCKKIKIEKNKTNIFYKIKNFINKRINSFSKNEYFQAFLLGDKNNFTNDFLNNIKINGINHLFAISGMHVSIFTLVFYYFLKKLKINHNFIFIIICVFLLFYLFLTDFSPSLIRAFMFFMLLKLNEIFCLKIKTLNIFLLSISVILFLNSNLIFNIGFIYSSVITFGLILSKNLIENKNYFIKLILISIISFLFSLPITSSNFYEINIVSIFNNLIFVPFISFIVYPVILLTFFLPFLEFFANITINILEILNNFFTSFSIKILLPKCNIIIYIIYYILLIFFILYKKLTNLILFIIILIIIFIYPKINFTNKIYFLDVGQGDSILLRSKFNKEIILIDTGGTINYNVKQWQKRKKEYHISDNTINFLKSLGINNIDLLIISHGDNDHAGEYLNIYNNVGIKKVMINKGKINYIEKKILNTKVKIIKKYQSKYFNMHYFKTKDFNNENDNSIILQVSVDNNKVLFMGDASNKVENYLSVYNLESDILKLGHHGSKTSTSLSFLNNVKPTLGIISSGLNNRYNHPSKEVIDRLNQKNIKYYNTAFNGTIKITFGHNNYKVKTYPA